MDELAAWLAALPGPQVERLSRHVLGTGLSSRAAAERALAQRLSDGDWIRATLSRLGPLARSATEALAAAGVPVRRSDLTSLTASLDEDPVDALEDHGLVAAVRTGPGMPTHISLVPGVAAHLAPPESDAPDATELRGAALGGARRKFQLALTLAQLVQHPPRTTRDGRPHATDLNRLAQSLGPLGLTAARLVRELSDLEELGALVTHEGRLVPVPDASDIPALHLRLALVELASPSLPEESAFVVSRLLEPGAVLSLAHLLNLTRTALLRHRAGEEDHGKGARRELVEILSSLLSLQALVLLDEQGHPLSTDHAGLLERAAAGETFSLALDPTVSAALRGDEAPTLPTRPGHVQASFEIVADASCDPSLVARVASFCRLVRADFAAVLRLERDSVKRALEAGWPLSMLIEALPELAGREVPVNVATHVADWSALAQAAKPVNAPPADIRVIDLVEAARESLRLGAEEVSRES